MIVGIDLCGVAGGDQTEDNHHGSYLGSGYLCRQSRWHDAGVPLGCCWMSAVIRGGYRVRSSARREPFRFISRFSRHCRPRLVVCRIPSSTRPQNGRTRRDKARANPDGSAEQCRTVLVRSPELGSVPLGSYRQETPLRCHPRLVPQRRPLPDRAQLRHFPRLPSFHTGFLFRPA